MSRRRPKVDSNHGEVVRALRAVDVRVVSLAGVGGGVPDLLTSYGGQTILIEVKNPDGRNKLTEDQEAFFRSWAGRAVVVTSAKEALQVWGMRWATQD